MAKSITQYAIDFIYAKRAGGKITHSSISTYKTRYEIGDLAMDDLVTKYLLLNSAGSTATALIINKDEGNLLEDGTGTGNWYLPFLDDSGNPIAAGGVFACAIISTGVGIGPENFDPTFSPPRIYGFTDNTAKTITVAVLFGSGMSPVTPGHGVPAGGSTGQVLAKVNGTDYNTNWVDQTGGVPGYTNRTFNPVVVFDAPFKSVYTQTGDITLSLGASPIADVIGRITIIGDGVHDLIFPTFDPTFAAVNWYNANGQTFDNTARNVINFEYDGYAVRYTIDKQSTPDVTAPSLVSAVISNSQPTKIVLTYSELLDTGSVPATGAFSCNLSKAVTAVSVVGSQVIITVNSAYAFGDTPTISYTVGGNPIQDPAHNHAANLSSQAVTNNVLPAATSITFVGSNQIPISSAVPSALAFGSGGTDTPMSISMWVKPSSVDGALCSIGSLANGATANQNLSLERIAGLLYFLFNGSGCYINANSTIPASAWIHIVATYSGNRLASGMKLYFNGALQAVSVGAASYGGQSAFIGDTSLIIGANSLGANTGSPSEPAYNYKFDHAYFWNKELTSGEVTALYNGGVNPDPTTLGITANLQARYEFDGDLLDQGPHGYNLSSAVAPTYSTDVP